MKEQDKKEFIFSLRRAKLGDPLDLTFLPANPNQNAKIGFLCQYPEDFWSLEPIAKHFKDGEFIFTTASFLRDDWEKTLIVFILNRLVLLAKEGGYHWRIYVPVSTRAHTSEDEYDMNRIALLRESASMLDFFQKYDVIASARMSNFLAEPALTHKKKILFWENPSIWIEPERLSYLDGVLTAGEYFSSLFSAFTKTMAIGNPRLESAKSVAAPQIKNPTLLYIPSRVNFNLIETANGILETLPHGLKFQILVPHFRITSRHVWNQTKNIPDIELLFRGETEPGRLIAAADIVIIEDAEHLLECVFFEKPLILLDTVFDKYGWNTEEQLMPQADTKHFGTDELTVADFGVVLKNTKSLPGAINILENRATKNSLQESLRRVKKLFFAEKGQKGVEDAIDFMRDIQTASRTPESLISRLSASYGQWERLEKLYKEKFGIDSPYTPITLRLLRFFLQWEQRK